MNNFITEVIQHYLRFIIVQCHHKMRFLKESPEAEIYQIIKFKLDKYRILRPKEK